MRRLPDSQSHAQIRIVRIRGGLVTKILEFRSADQVASVSCYRARQLGNGIAQRAAASFEG